MYELEGIYYNREYYVQSNVSGSIMQDLDIYMGAALDYVNYRVGLKCM